jgi:hypothetical protein
MTPDDIHRLIAGAPPGAQIEIISITIPDAPAVAAATAAEGAADPSGQWTEEQIVEWVRRTYGEHGIKPHEWANLLPSVSGRQLRTAVRLERVRWDRKGHGRDHAARLIPPDAMLSYLHSPARRRRPGAGS